MPGASIEVKSNEQEVQGVLRQLLSRFGNLTPLMKQFGAIALTSIQRNFELGGRPIKWAPLSKTTLARRKGNRPLVIRGMAGGLMGSLTYRASATSVRIGTNKQSGWLNFGAKKGAFGAVVVARKSGRAGRSGATLFSHVREMKIPWGDVPARQYLMIQDENWGEMKATAGDYLLRGR